MMLEVHDVARHFDKRTVFSGVGFALADGERLLLTGGNGSGKTTLLRCLAGTLALSAGTVSVDGHPTGSRDARAKIGVCLNPEQAFYLRLSGRENLRFAARLILPEGLVDAAVERVEDELGITAFADQRMHKYSSGMRSRVAIARALLGQPLIVLLDEPTRSLDAEARARLWAVLDVRRLGCVIASHRGSDRSHCDRELDVASFR